MLFASVTALGAGLLIAGELTGNRTAVCVFKPLAIATVIAMVLLSSSRPTSKYRLLIATGLLWSAAGDVLLMLPGNLFAPGAQQRRDARRDRRALLSRVGWYARAQSIWRSDR